MKTGAEIISERERDRRARQSAASTRRLLYTRQETADMLGGISIKTVIRLEKAGKLVARKLSGADNGLVTYTATSVLALAGIEQEVA